MWSFLNPAALFGLFAAGIPLVLHLLSRRKVKIVEFSSLAFLNKMKQTRMRYVRLREILLLIIRTLIIAFLVLGFSRPVYRSGAGGGSGPTSTVILLDDSYSMGLQTPSGTVFETAKSKIVEFLETVEPGDEIAVIPFSETENPRYQFLSPDPSYFEKALPEFSVTADTAEPLTAIKKASGLLKNAGNPNKELIIISDYQLCGWTYTRPLKNSLDESEANILFMDIHQPTDDNVLLTDVNFGGSILQPGIGFDINAEIANPSERRIDRILADLYIDNARISQTDITLSPGEVKTIELRAGGTPAGVHGGYIELDDDPLLIDNRRYFSFKIPEKVNILIAGGSEELARTIETALVPPGIIGSHIRVERVGVSRMVTIGMGEFDAAILPDYRPNPALASRFKTFLDAGKGIFIIPAAGINPSAFNRDLQVISFPAEISGELFPGEEAFYKLKSIDTGHPVFSIYRGNDAERSYEIPEIVFSSIYSARITGRASIPAELSGDKPLLIIGDSGQGKAVLSTAPFSSNISDITSSSLFVPLMHRLTGFISSGAGEYGGGVYVNQPVQVNLDISQTAGEITVTTPGGNVVNVKSEIGSSGEYILFEDTSEPGIYYVKSGDKNISAFAVNVNPRESRAGAVDVKQLEDYVSQGTHHIIAGSGKEMSSLLKEFRIGKEYTYAGFGIVLALLALEMLVAGRWRKPKEE
ncbi:MAG: VWA domain-containing protein [candidate division Zixibacteria bacterium]|nr:VWA domain-containing protein [candidate division Zixibacteria bacterium]